MSIVLERNSSGGAGDCRIERPELVQRNMVCVSSICDSVEFSQSDRVAEEAPSGSLSSSSTSSIGKNSDESSGGGDDEEEVQSKCKAGALDSLEDLEDVLPVKKSISNFYRGKSKSFTSLSDATSCSSIKDIAKPDNAYTRKRKNLLAFNNFWDKNHNSVLRNSSGGISKRSASSTSMLSLAAAANFSECNNGETSGSNSPSPRFCLPPLPPHARKATASVSPLLPPVNKFSSLRSFSLMDLQDTATAQMVTPSISGFWINNSEMKQLI